jgi:AAA domain
MNTQVAGECLLTYIESMNDENNKRKNVLDIPLRSDGSEYTIENLAEDQKQALSVVIEHIKNYCESQLSKENMTLRLTVAGVAGSGKSTWINTLVSLVRQLFNYNGAIGVYGPTGSAAFNAGGETINRGFRVPIPIMNLNIAAEKQAQLQQKFAQTVAIVIDERSMVEADKLGCVKHYMNQCAHGGMTEMEWGSIPAVILVGDDYQLPPIGFGAFYALVQKTLSDNPQENNKKIKNQRAAEMKCRVDGYEEFKLFAKNTVYLESIKRVNEDQEQLRRILQGLRGQETSDSLSDVDIQRLLALDIKHEDYTRKEREEIRANSMYLFATKEPRDAFNDEMLLKANRKGNPVARMKSITVGKNEKRVANNHHYDSDRCPAEVLLCKTARVALNGQNISPVLGLYHGSLGIIEDIVYHAGESPYHGDLPAYVLVKFTQYCGNELVPHAKQSVPIPPMKSRCKFGCCTRTYIPLTLAYGKTIHTFQGQTVGPAGKGRPENPIQRIVLEPGDRKFEGNNVGLFYTAMSRATTIGNTGDRMSSAVYFDSPHFSIERFTNLTRQKNGQMYHKALLRQNWVRFMKEKNENRKQYTKEEMKKLFHWITSNRINLNTISRKK